MTIQGLDPSGELGKLFFQIHSKVDQENRSLPPKASPGHSTDAVDLSGLAKDIGVFSAQAAQLPEVRSQKIQGILEVLNRGEEIASPSQVAEALTRETILNALSR